MASKIIRESIGSVDWRRRMILISFAFLVVNLTYWQNLLTGNAQQRFGITNVTASFSDKGVKPNEKIEVRFNGDILPGGYAVVLNDTDLTAMFERDDDRLTYLPVLFPLPIGANKLRVYSIENGNTWRLVRELDLKVADLNYGSPEATRTKVDFTPSISINFKGERNINFFPESAKPQRPAFIDTAGQASFQIKVTNAGWSIGGQFDLAGSSRQNEALRFGELGDRAPSVDLSSYRIEAAKGRFKAELGHISFGSQRHLINGFSSRGLGLTIPIGKQNEVTFSAMNGTSIVGFDNFAGLSRSSHQILGITFAREFIKERPGGLRLEVTAMRGSLLPLDNFNQRTVNDAERSYGGSFRIQFKDKQERIRFEGGYTSSRFTNRADALLSQGVQLTQVRAVTRGARFLELSFNIIKDKKLFDERKLGLSGTFRHEEIEPLFRSVAASSQADQQQNQFEIAANFGDISFNWGHLRSNDNLENILSILRTLNRRHYASFAFSPGTMFDPKKPIKYLPRISYTYERVHQFGDRLPIGGQFNSLSQVPDQENVVHSLNAELPITDKIRFAYRFNQAFQDNRQPGRERADLGSNVNSFNVSISHFKDVQIGFDLSRESQRNLETGRVDQQWRIGSNISIMNLVVKNVSFNTNISSTIAGDITNITDSRNIEYDAQLSYRFGIGKKKYRKFETQLFVRYSNRYGSRIDRLFVIRDINRFQGFNAGLTFNIL